MPVELEEILKVVRRQLGLKSVAAGDHLQSDLGVESIDLQGIFAALEDRFDIVFDDEDLAPVETVRDIHDLVDAKS